MEDVLSWAQQLNCAITVCDTKGIIIYINEKAAKTFSKWGGHELLGKNLFECHMPKSQETIKRLIENGETNAYTIEKLGVKKMIYQTPWYTNGIIAGMVELSLEIPLEMPHFVRS